MGNKTISFIIATVAKRKKDLIKNMKLVHSSKKKCPKVKKHFYILLLY